MNTKFKTSELIKFLDKLTTFFKIQWGLIELKEEDNLKLEEIKRILFADEARRNYANHLEDFNTDGVNNYLYDND